MQTLTDSLLQAQQSGNPEPFLRLTFSKTGESDIVVEQDRMLPSSGDATPDSQKAGVVFNNSDGYFTSLDLLGWTAVIELGLRSSAGIEYISLPPLKVISQTFSSIPGVLTCFMHFIGIPDRLQLDVALKDYNNHWSNPKTVKTLIAEILSLGGSLTNGTGTATGAPITLVAGANTVVVTADGTFTIVIPVGSVGKAVSGTATVSGSPVSLVAGSQTITVSGGGAGKTIIITASITELTEEQTANDGFETIYGATNSLVGVARTVTNQTCTKLAFLLKKVGTPGGNVTFSIYKSPWSASDLIQQTTLATSAIPYTTATWQEVTWTTPAVINEKVWFTVEYTGGDAANYVQVAVNSTAVKPYEALVLQSTETRGPLWEDDTSTCAYRYKYTEGTSATNGITCFNHCQPYDAVFDSEDSLIDVYLPAAGFKIPFGGSRLAAVHTLLKFTTCRMIVKTDGKVHIFVPTIALVTTWTSPTSFTEQASPTDWANEANAYDGNTGTDAYSILGVTGWTVFLELTHAALSCDHVKFYARQPGDGYIDIDVYDSVTSAWVDVYEGAYTEDAWVTKSLDRRRTVTKVRMRFSITATGTVSVYEVMFGSDNYAYIYSRGIGGHDFYTKTVRNGLIIPNRITVESFPGTVPFYDGEATSAASYAILPITFPIRAELTSLAQADSIAEAMIAQLEAKADQGRTNVPINLGAEVYDYVKVIDDREADSKIGNIGAVHWAYVPGKSWNTSFTFGEINPTAITGSFQTPPHETISGMTLKEFIEETEATFNRVRDLLKQLFDSRDAIETSMGAPLPFAQWLELQFLAFHVLYPRLANIVEDLTPQLGGDLDTNGKAIAGDLTPDIDATWDLGGAAKRWYYGYIQRLTIGTSLEMDSHSLTNMSTTVDMTNLTDNTQYQNTTNAPILFVVTVTLAATEGATLYADSTTGPTTVRASCYNPSAASSLTTLSFLLPAGWFIKVDVETNSSITRTSRIGVGV